MEKWVIAVFLGLGSVNDARKKEIPAVLPFVFGIPGILLQLGRMLTGDGAADTAWIAGGMAGLFLIALGRMTDQAVGYGDGLVAAVVGIWMGILPLIEIFFLGLVPTAVYSGWLFWVRRTGGKYRLPFLPFLLAGYLLWLLLEKGGAGV